MRLLSQAVKLAKAGFNFGGYGGGAYGINDPYGGWYRPNPGSNFDYRREAGILWENSIILPCVKWAIKGFLEAPLICERTNAKGEWEKDTDGHPLIDLLDNPNPYYDGDTLWAGSLISDLIDGNDYWFLNPSRAMLPAEIYYLPHFQVSLMWEKPTDFVTKYRYRPQGLAPKDYDPKLVAHFRNGLDPLNFRKGLSDCGAILREVCSDNEASTAAAATMRNMGLIGLFMSPREPGRSLTDPEREKLQEMGKAKFTGERRGEPYVSTIGMDIEQLGFSPEQMAFDAVRRIPEERITAAFGIPAVVVGMGAGLERATLANVENLERKAYRSMLVPLWKRRGKQLSRRMLPVYGDDPKKCRLVFDTSKVQGLQEDMNAKSKRIEGLYKGEIIMRSEARREIGEEVDEARDNVFYKPTKTSSNDDPLDGQPKKQENE